MALDGNVTLLVTPEVMLNISRQFSECNNGVKELTRRMLDIVNTLQSGWKGDAATIFYNKLAALEPDMTKIHAMIEEHANDLILITQQFRTAEEDIIGITESLPSAELP